MIERLRQWLPWLLATGLLCAIYGRMNIIPRHVHNIGFSEPNVVDGVIRLLDGLPLYGNPEEPPYDIVQYSPIHYYVCLIIGAPLRMGHHDPHAVFQLSRWVALAANLLSCWLLWRVGRYLGLAAWARMLMAGVFFTGLHEPYFGRPDSVYQVFCILFIHAALRMVDAPTWNWRNIGRCALFGALCVFGKQSGAGLVGAIGAGLLMMQRWDLVWRFTSATLGIALLLLGVLAMHNGLYNTYANIVLGNVNGWSWPWFVFDPREPFMGSGLWMTPAALMAAWAMWRRDLSQRAVFLLTTLVVTYAWAFVTCGKVGSNMNYFTEHWVLCVITLLLYIGEWVPTMGVVRLAIIGGLSGIVFLRSASLCKTFGFSPYPADESVAYADDMRATQVIEQHGLAPDEGVFVVGQNSFIDQALGARSWLKQKDIINLSSDALVLDHTAMFDNARNARLRYIITPDTTDILGLRKEVFTGWRPSFAAGRYTVYERGH